jgi:hypothetical protein
MIDIQKHEGFFFPQQSTPTTFVLTLIFLGWLPECREATVMQYIQGGSSQ